MIVHSAPELAVHLNFIYSSFEKFYYAICQLPEKREAENLKLLFSSLISKSATLVFVAYFDMFGTFGSSDANLMKWLSRIKITSKVEDETGASTFHSKQHETSNTSKVQISQNLNLFCLILGALLFRKTSCHCPSPVDPTYASKANETDLSKSDQKFEDSYPATKWFSRVQRNDKTTLPKAI